MLLTNNVNFYPKIWIIGLCRNKATIIAMECYIVSLESLLHHNNSSAVACVGCPLAVVSFWCLLLENKPWAEVLNPYVDLMYNLFLPCIDLKKGFILLDTLKMKI